jgi:hypothetical protein
MLCRRQRHHRLRTQLATGRRRARLLLSAEERNVVAGQHRTFYEEGFNAYPHGDSDSVLPQAVSYIWSTRLSIGGPRTQEESPTGRQK